MAGANVNCYSNSGVETVSQEDSFVNDLSIIPLKKDSYAICETCGVIARREFFYPRNNKVCSLTCHKRGGNRRRFNWKYKIMEDSEHMSGMIPLEPLPQLQTWRTTFNDLQVPPLKHTANLIANSYEWKDELFGCDFLAAPVSLFKHAPLHEMWDNTFEGMKVEVKNTDCDNYSEKLGDYFWVATVLKVKGYMGLLRYEGFGSDDSKDFWVNLCCSEVHPVGWCATRGKPLIPPKSIEDKYSDWKKFPKDEYLRIAWIKNINRKDWQPNSSTVVFFHQL